MERLCINSFQILFIADAADRDRQIAFGACKQKHMCVFRFAHRVQHFLSCHGYSSPARGHFLGHYTISIKVVYESKLHWATVS